MRLSSCVIALLLAFPLFAQKGPHVYDRTGTVSFIRADADLTVITDHTSTSCFGGDTVVCSNHYAGGVVVANMQPGDGLWPQQNISIHYGDLSHNPLLDLASKLKRGESREFKYRLDFMDINYYNKHKPVFCVPSFDKNGKQRSKEACYPIY